MRPIGRLCTFAAARRALPLGLSPSAGRRLASSSSVVETALSSSSSSAKPAGVDITPGEVLVFSAGPGARRIILGHWLSSVIVDAYVLLSNIASHLLPADPQIAAGIAEASATNSAAGTGVGIGAALMSSQTGWFGAVMAGAGVAFTALAVSSSRAQVRHAVLSADGHHLKVYTFSPYFGIGSRKPIVLPIKLLSLAGGPGDKVEENSGKPQVASAPGNDGKASKKKGSKFTEDLFVRVKGSSQSILFDKPSDLLELCRIRGTGLIFNDRGLLSIDAGPSAASSPGAAPSSPSSPFSLTPSALYAYPAEVREAVRRYALLVRVLSGHPVSDMERLRQGSWELEEMNEQISNNSGTTTRYVPSHGGSDATALQGSLASKVGDLVYWRKATDSKTGKTYWWHSLTWASQWMPPVVEGKDPYQWHPHLKEMAS